MLWSSSRICLLSLVDPCVFGPISYMFFTFSFFSLGFFDHRDFFGLLGQFFHLSFLFSKTQDPSFSPSWVKLLFISLSPLYFFFFFFFLQAGLFLLPCVWILTTFWTSTIIEEVWIPSFVQKTIFFTIINSLDWHLKRTVSIYLLRSKFRYKLDGNFHFKK